MSMIEQPTFETITNYAPNPECKGSGVFAELARNRFVNPRLKGSGTWVEVRRNKAVIPIPNSAWYTTTSAGGTGSGVGTLLPNGGVNDVPVYQIEVTETLNSGRYFRIIPGSVAQRRVVVTAGERVEVSIDLAAVGLRALSNVRPIVGWYDTSGAYISEMVGPGEPISTDRSNPTRVFLSGIVPAGATRGEFMVHFGGNGLPAGAKVWASRLMFGPGNYFDGATRDLSVPYPEDFRTRWLGAANNSESVLEGEWVAGFSSTANTAVGIVSKIEGKPAVRIIATAANNAYVEWLIPTTVRSGGTIRAKAHILTALPAPGQGGVGIRTMTPDTRTGNFYSAGVHQLVHTYTSLSTAYRAIFMHGDAAGSPDVWITDIIHTNNGISTVPFNGSSLPSEVEIEQPEDFRFRWLGTPDNSESVMEIEQVRDATPNQCVVGVSTWNGEPALRIISRASGTDGSSASFSIPSNLRVKGTLLGTIGMKNKQPEPNNWFSRTMRVLSPDQSNVATKPPNTIGLHESRLVYNDLTGTWATAYWNHGGGPTGVPDVWWINRGMFEGDYDGPAFSGDTEELYYKNQRVFPKWDGEPHKSTSSFTYEVRHDIDPDPIITKWNPVGERYYETGIDRGMLYTYDGKGIPWNGLTSVDETPNGGAASGFYNDGVKYLNVPGPEEYTATLKAFTYPDEFELHDGTATNGKGLLFDSQPRRPFGLSYRTRVGNDLDGATHAYKLHIVFNALASPSNRAYNTLGDNIEPVDFSWALSVVPERLDGAKATAHLIVDSRRTDPYLLRELEEILYGTEKAPARLPTGKEIQEFFDEWITLLIIDHGDGTYTASGPDEVVKMLNDHVFQIDWPSAEYITNDTYTLTTL